ncbi:MAG: sugar ABC transporter permease [Clostridiales bacterium]|nr:sugar ABC transporter permease [Clostridiales bacterium]
MTSAAKAAAPKTKRRGASLQAKKQRAGWIFVLPFIVGLIIVYLPIVVNSIIVSFHKFSPLREGYALDFVGLENYQYALFKDTDFVQKLVSGIQSLIFSIPAIVIFSLFMAVLLNQKMLGRAAFRAIFFVPVILSTGIVEKMDLGNKMISDLGESAGIDTGAAGASGEDANQIVSIVDIENLFSNMAVGTGLVKYVVTLVNGVYDIINRSGVQMLIFLAGLQSISPAIYESCSIDGATTWETFWKITFPMISPMILVNAIYTIIDSFTSGKNEVMTYINQVYTSSGGNVRSAAMSWIYFLIVMVVVGIAAALISSYIFYQRKD